MALQFAGSPSVNESLTQIPLETQDTNLLTQKEQSDPNTVQILPSTPDEEMEMDDVDLVVSSPLPDAVLPAPAVSPITPESSETLVNRLAEWTEETVRAHRKRRGSSVRIANDSSSDDGDHESDGDYHEEQSQSQSQSPKKTKIIIRKEKVKKMNLPLAQQKEPETAASEATIHVGDSGEEASDSGEAQPDDREIRATTAPATNHKRRIMPERDTLIPAPKPPKRNRRQKPSPLQPSDREYHKEFKEHQAQGSKTFEAALAELKRTQKAYAAECKKNKDLEEHVERLEEMKPHRDPEVVRLHEVIQKMRTEFERAIVEKTKGPEGYVKIMDNEFERFWLSLDNDIENCADAIHQRMSSSNISFPNSCNFPVQLVQVLVSWRTNSELSQAYLRNWFWRWLVDKIINDTEACWVEPYGKVFKAFHPPPDCKACDNNL